MNSVAAYLNDNAVEAAITGGTWAAGDNAFVGVTLNDGTTALYEVVNSSITTVVAGEIAFVGLVQGTVTSGQLT